VVAWDIDEANALAHFPQKLLNDVVVLLWPVPARLQAPAINDVPDEINRIGINIPQKV
jgi:hypothetical protein